MTQLIPLFQLALTVHRDPGSEEYVVTTATGRPKRFTTLKGAGAYLSTHLALVANAVTVKGIDDRTLNDVEPR